MSGALTESMKSSERLERCRRYGFDCADFLEWKGWDVGGEYKLTISLKNVGKKMAAIKYKLPASKYFGMEFPMVAKVSPGMSYHVDVVFRPIHMEAYDDEILFTTPMGDFAIPIRAVLLSKSFFVAESFEFGFCPTMEMSEGVFEVRQRGLLGAGLQRPAKGERIGSGRRRARARARARVEIAAVRLVQRQPGCWGRLPPLFSRV
jgi:hypothetical protein